MSLSYIMPCYYNEALQTLINMLAQCRMKAAVLSENIACNTNQTLQPLYGVSHIAVLVGRWFKLLGWEKPGPSVAVHMIGPCM